MPGSPTSGTSARAADVQKSFGAVRRAALGQPRASQAGSIHALVGENGAGKSTLVKIVAGVHRRDAGTFRFHGEDVDFRSTAESKAAGIAVIYQEPTLFPDLSVTENIFMGRQPLRRGRRIDRAGDVRRGRGALRPARACDLDPRRPAQGLSIADQQIIEIAKAISLDASLLIMDEPTAALSGVEVERLFAVARSLRDEGRGLVFISHRFDEVFALCDTVTVMRDGAYVSTEPIADTTVDAAGRADGRPRGRRPLPQDRGRRSATSSSRSTGSSAPASSTTSASRSAPARSSASPGWSAPAAARSPGPSSASTRYDSGTVRLAGQAGPAARPARRHPGRDGLRPRGPPQAGAGHRRARSPATSPR